MKERKKGGEEKSNKYSQTKCVHEHVCRGGAGYPLTETALSHECFFFFSFLPAIPEWLRQSQAN